MKQIFRETEYLLDTAEEFNLTVKQERAFIISQALFVVAEVDGNIVGSASLYRSRKTKLNHVAIFGITILQKYCGLGIGSMMIESVIRWSRENGIEIINLEVFEGNIRAQRLYKRFGFIVEGRKNRYIKMNGKYQDMILMTKILD